MCGSGNNSFSGNGFQPCTIILIILILKNLCLLDTDHNPSAKNALTLLFLFWLCSCGGFGGNRGFNSGMSCNNMSNCGCMNQCCSKCC